MGFSNEEHLEEILYQAHNKGKYIKLLRKVEKLRKKGFKGNRTDIYFKAWEKVK